MPSSLLSDTFTATAGTALSAHTSDSGHTWTPLTGSGSTDLVISSANRVRSATASGYPSFYSSWSPASPQYDIYTTITRVDYSNPANAAFGFIFNYDTTNKYYYSFVAIAAPTGSGGNSNTVIYCQKINASGPTLLTTSATFTYIDNALWRLRTQAGSQTLAYSTDTGSTWNTVASTSDVDATLTGSLAGITLAIASTDTAGFAMDNLYTQYNSAQTLPPDTAGIVLSPGNQYVVPATSLQWIHTATSAKFNFTGTSLAVNIDLSLLAAGSIPSTNYPYLNYSIDGSPWQRTQVTASLTLAAGLTAATHTAEIRYEPNDESNTWAPYSAIKITGWTLDLNATITAPTGNATARLKKAMILGDSITRGYAASNMALLSFGVLLGHALNAEIGIVGYSGQGWDHAATNAAPDFRSTFGKYDSAHTTTFPALDYLLIAQGTNYGGGDLSTIIPSQLTTIRAAIGNNTLIGVILPVNGSQTTAITSAVNAYIQSSFDTRITLIDLTSRHYGFLTNGSSPAIQYSVDGIHPTTEAHALIAADIAKTIGQFENTTTLHAQASAGGLLAGL